MVRKLKTSDMGVIALAILLFLAISSNLGTILQATVGAGVQAKLISKSTQFNNVDIEVKFRIVDGNVSLTPDDLAVEATFDDDPIDLEFLPIDSVYTSSFETTQTGVLKLIITGTVDGEAISKLLAIEVKKPLINIDAVVPNNIFVGETHELTFSFTDQFGKAIELDSVELRISDPSETGVGQQKFKRTEILTKQQTGRYILDFKFDLIGDYIFEVTPIKDGFDTIPLIRSATVFDSAKFPFGLVIFGSGFIILLLLIVRQLIFRGGLRR